MKRHTLAIPCFSARMPDILVAPIDSVARSEDIQVRAVLDTNNSVHLAERLINMCRPYGLRDQQRGHWRSRLEAYASCAGLTAHFLPKQTTSWARHPPAFWDGSTYIKGFRLRAGVLPTVGGLHNRHLPFQDHRYRAGCNVVESACHILQKFRVPITSCSDDTTTWWTSSPSPPPPKVGMSRLSRISVAPTATTHSGLRILVCRRGDCVIVADITVSWERPDPLTTAHRNKVAIYLDPHFIEAIRKSYAGTTPEIHALAVGARDT